MLISSLSTADAKYTLFNINDYSRSRYFISDRGRKAESRQQHKEYPMSFQFLYRLVVNVLDTNLSYTFQVPNQ